MASLADAEDGLVVVILKPADLRTPVLFSILASMSLAIRRHSHHLGFLATL